MSRNSGVASGGGGGGTSLYRQVKWSITHSDLNSALATAGHVVATLAAGEYFISQLSFISVPVAFNGSNPGINLIDFDVATGTTFASLDLTLADSLTELVLGTPAKMNPAGNGSQILLNPVAGSPCPIVAQVLDTATFDPYVTPGSTAGSLTVMLTIGSLV